jgi:hypothetical protein
LAKPILWAITKALEVKPVESGERHLFAATSPTFTPNALSESVQEAAAGSDGLKGSGSYLMNWNNDVLPDKAAAKKMRDEGAEQKVFDHTQEMFKKVCEEGGKY